MVRTQIQLTEEQVKALKKIALSRHLSIAEIIRQAVDTVIRTNTMVGIEERRKRAIDIVGRFSSGKRDISRKHDTYLVEAFGKLESLLIHRHFLPCSTETMPTIKKQKKYGIKCSNLKMSLSLQIIFWWKALPLYSIVLAWMQ